STTFSPSTTPCRLLNRRWRRTARSAAGDLSNAGFKTAGRFPELHRISRKRMPSREKFGSVSRWLPALDAPPVLQAAAQSNPKIHASGGGENARRDRRRSGLLL